MLLEIYLYIAVAMIAVAIIEADTKLRISTTVDISIIFISISMKIIVSDFGQQVMHRDIPSACCRTADLNQRWPWSPRSSLVQVTYSAPSQCQNQYWLILDWILSDIGIKIRTIFFTKMHLKISAKRLPFYLVINASDKVVDIKTCLSLYIIWSYTSPRPCSYLWSFSTYFM